MTKKQNLEERFWSKVRRTEGCWEWTAGVGQQNGYGRIQIDGRAVYAHRLSWELAFGPIPEGEANHFANLSERDVLEIRKLLEAGERQVDIAARFGVQQGAISKIKTGRSWRWLKSA